jgi:hypothetical protein
MSSCLPPPLPRTGSARRSDRSQSTLGSVYHSAHSGSSQHFFSTHGSEPRSVSEDDESPMEAPGSNSQDSNQDSNHDSNGSLYLDALQKQLHQYHAHNLPHNNNNNYDNNSNYDIYNYNSRPSVTHSDTNDPNYYFTAREPDPWTINEAEIDSWSLTVSTDSNGYLMHFFHGKWTLWWIALGTLICIGIILGVTVIAMNQQGNNSNATTNSQTTMMESPPNGSIVNGTENTTSNTTNTSMTNVFSKPSSPSTESEGGSTYSYMDSPILYPKVVYSAATLEPKEDAVNVTTVKKKNTTQVKTDLSMERPVSSPSRPTTAQQAPTRAPIKSPTRPTSTTKEQQQEIPTLQPSSMRPHKKPSKGQGVISSAEDEDACVDDLTHFFKVPNLDEPKDCTWLRMNTAMQFFLCDQGAASKYCPRTCHICTPPAAVPRQRVEGGLSFVP